MLVNHGARGAAGALELVRKDKGIAAALSFTVK